LSLESLTEATAAESATPARAGGGDRRRGRSASGRRAMAVAGLLTEGERRRRPQAIRVLDVGRSLGVTESLHTRTEGSPIPPQTLPFGRRNLRKSEARNTLRRAPIRRAQPTRSKRDQDSGHRRSRPRRRRAWLAKTRASGVEVGGEVAVTGVEVIGERQVQEARASGAVRGWVSSSLEWLEGSATMGGAVGSSSQPAASGHADVPASAPERLARADGSCGPSKLSFHGGRLPLVPVARG